MYNRPAIQLDGGGAVDRSDLQKQQILEEIEREREKNYQHQLATHRTLAGDDKMGPEEWAANQVNVFTIDLKRSALKALAKKNAPAVREVLRENSAEITEETRKKLEALLNKAEGKSE